MNILLSDWKSGGTGTVGIVAYSTPSPENPLGWCAAIGCCKEDNTQQADEQWIAGYGCKLSWEEAHVFFPTFDITKYKYYEKE